ncbi:MAG: hypothetical protein EAZ92_09145 [Candidatus Kapaibacterium sp.]|nr:MAG: hypothetical protein EAZ92_09145 [Candidatus Kapabacteria bacterium]
MERKRQFITWNRRISWVMAALSLVMSCVRGFAPTFSAHNKFLLDGISGVVFLYTLLHIGLAVWLFRFPRFEWRTKSLFIWCGYAMLPTLVVGAAAYGTPLARINYVVSCAVFIPHITLGAWHALQRMNVQMPLRYSLSGLAAVCMTLSSVLGWMTEM